MNKYMKLLKLRFNQARIKFVEEEGNFIFDEGLIGWNGYQKQWDIFMGSNDGSDDKSFKALDQAMKYIVEFRESQKGAK